LDGTAKYALVHGRPGKVNHFQGLMVDWAYRIHWRSMFGYNLIRALGPTTSAKSTVNRQLAFIFALPHFYRDAVETANTHSYAAPFVPQDGASIELHRAHIPDNERQNFGATEALRILLRNRIPPEWIDHAYPYGVAYLDQHFFGQSQLIDTFTEIDDERIARLQQYGTPPAIAAWDGWREITTDERYMIYAQHSEDDFFERPPAEHNGFYYPIGADILRERLWNRAYPSPQSPHTAPEAENTTNVVVSISSLAVPTTSAPPTSTNPEVHSPELLDTSRVPSPFVESTNVEHDVEMTPLPESVNPTHQSTKSLP
ncbi:hypothetical protein H0H93_011519, partial [Arthromyces matolae]